MTQKSFNSYIRWLHIYLSMFGFAALFFFAVTGLTLNHPGWIEKKQKVEKVEGILDKSLLLTDNIESDTREEIVERIRNSHKIKARLTDFRIDDSEYSLSFSGPGYSAEAYIRRQTGSYEITIVSGGFFSVINDLHTGRDTGRRWTAVIDISAIFMVVVSLTGFVMIFFLTRRKSKGLWVAILGAMTFLLLCLILI
jgi:hypothetical protein